VVPFHRERKSANSQRYPICKPIVANILVTCAKTLAATAERTLPCARHRLLNTSQSISKLRLTLIIFRRHLEVF